MNAAVLTHARPVEPEVEPSSSMPPLRRTLDRLAIEPIDPAAVTSYKRLKLKQAHRQALLQWAPAALILLTLLCVWSVIEHLLFPQSAITLPMVALVALAAGFTAIGIEAATHYFSNLPGWSVWITVPVMTYSRRALRESGLPKEVKEQVRAITCSYSKVCFVMHRLDDDPILDVIFGPECYTIAIWD